MRVLLLAIVQPASGDWLTVRSSKRQFHPPFGPPLTRRHHSAPIVFVDDNDNPSVLGQRSFTAASVSWGERDDRFNSSLYTFPNDTSDDSRLHSPCCCGQAASSQRSTRKANSLKAQGLAVFVAGCQSPQNCKKSPGSFCRADS